ARVWDLGLGSGDLGFLVSSNPPVLEHPHDGAAVLGLPFPGRVARDLIADAPRCWNIHLRGRDAALIQDGGNRRGALSAETLIAGLASHRRRVPLDLDGVAVNAPRLLRQVAKPRFEIR